MMGLLLLRLLLLLRSVEKEEPWRTAREHTILRRNSADGRRRVHLSLILLSRTEVGGRFDPRLQKQTRMGKTEKSAELLAMTRTGLLLGVLALILMLRSRAEEEEEEEKRHCQSGQLLGWLPLLHSLRPWLGCGEAGRGC
jgi:hypothetical protein